MAGAVRRGEATEAEPEERPALGGRGGGGDADRVFAVVCPAWD